ncbi:hypothetical protein DKX38_026707 [Salix brachista]|uniref:ABC transporter domain-containing protein n=1 Tax=Salix brachista TaxID=2182728 RepID=A0A5N5JA67_9ROSI|nr:hypothetical protein DKX38_026707 [Salix brachista]
MASFLQPSNQPNESGPTAAMKSSGFQTPLEVETVSKNALNDSAKSSPGVFLTWNDLWVTIPNRKHGGKKILQGLTGYAQPGELLAIMRPSGCGKSTLLDALSGSNARQAGEILINGRKQASAYGTSAYVTQDDTLVTTLTVREAVFYSAQLQLPDSMSMAEKMERAEIIIREMGLQDAMNTRIGGWGDKGLSGGQKRRVSICIVILTHPKLLFLDEPTSGLDSAASYYVMRGIARLDHKDGIRRTVIASIHQPSSEVFRLFSNLCLLSSGKTVYFGPASAANEDLEQGSDDVIPTEEVIDTLVKSYISSEYWQQVQVKVAEICKEDFAELESRDYAGFLTQSLVLTKRSFVNMFRDLGYYWLRLAIYVGLGYGLASIYHDLGSSYGSIQARGSLLMFVSTFLTFMAIGGFPSFVEEMKVFERERLNGHYGATSFVIGNTFSAIPFLLLISLIPGAIAYYLSGLHKGYEHFLYFASTLFACLILVERSGIQGLMVLGGGFFRLPDDLPKPFWRYPLHYVAFHRYAYQGMFKNEFEGLKFSNYQGNGLIKGEEILRDFWQMEMGYSKWVDLAILLGMVVFYRLLFLAIIKTTETIKPLISRLLSVNPRQTFQVMENSQC